MAEKKKFLLRVDPELFEALERWALDEFRSVNAQVEYALRDALRRQDRLKGKASPNDSEDPNEPES